jgi:hypothetical protein
MNPHSGVIWMNVWLSSFVFTKELSHFFFSGDSKRDPIVRGDERSARFIRREHCIIIVKTRKSVSDAVRYFQLRNLKRYW